MPLDLRELYRVKSLYYDPSNPVTKLYWRSPRSRIRFGQATVVENKDPDKLGRVKIEMKIFADNAVTDWCPVARPFAGANMGMFTVPQIKDTVIVAFVNDNINFPVVLGCIYDRGKRMAPPTQSNPDNDLKKFTSKSGMEIVLNDKSGEEQIVIRTKDGKMELNLTKVGGITLKNELGDVVIDCDTFLMETANDATIKSEKSASFEAESLDLKSSKGVTVKSSGNVIVKGSKIKLKGTGITAENKQLAVKGDIIFGIDNHQVKIPTQSGPQPGPVLPHPFIGDLKDDLSQDVLINSKNVAVKGSKGKTKVHMQMPPGVMFNKAPDKIGIVDKNCIDSVKVNGKAVAVLMAECKTCNDPGPTAMVPAKVLAFGTAINLPANLLGLDPNRYRSTNGNVRINTRDMQAGAGAGNNNRSLSNPAWDKPSATVGEEITLSVTINSYPNAAVTFTVWKEGADQQTETPITTVRSTSANGRAENKWRIDLSKTLYQLTAQTTRSLDKAGSISSVTGIKERLKALGYYSGATTNSDMNEETKSSIQRFQTAQGLAADGELWEETLQKLDQAYDDYKSQQQQQQQQQDQNQQQTQTQQQTLPDQMRIIFVADSHDCLSVTSQAITITMSYLEIEFVDENGNKVPNEAYEVILPDGNKLTGNLDANGQARIPVPTADECKVIFPKRDEGSWEKQ